MVSVWGGEWGGPEGLKFTYPDSWKAVNPDFKLPPATARFLAMSGLKANAYEVFLVRQVQGDGRTAFFVSVLPVALPPNAITETQMVGQIKATIAMAGARIVEFKTGHIQVDKRPALSVAYECVPAGAADAIRDWEVVVFDARQTYRVGCFATKAQWADVFPDVKKMLDSVRIDQAP
jgi:hypothetical protein